jgi:all-trans-retinol 13,14-reductase
MNKNTVPESTEAAVIGAGLGGLVCAIELQRHGVQTCIFEKKHIPGGYAHSFKRKDYIYDVSLHHLGGLAQGDMTYNILSPLGVLDKLEYTRKENLFSAKFPDFSIDMPNDKDAGMELLCSMFPSEKQGISDFYKLMQKLKHHVTAPVLFGDFKTPPEQLESFKYASSTFSQLLSAFISDPKLKAVLCQMWNYLGLPPETASANYSACIFASGFIEGAYHIKGGGAALAEALAQRFQELGGIICYRNGVSRIIAEGNAVKGLVLDKGEHVATKLVVSNANPHDTFFNMLDNNVLSQVFKARVKGMEVSNSLHAMYVGLDCLPSQLGVPANNYFYNHQYDYTKAYKDCMDGDHSKTDWCSTNPELAETGIAPSGCGIVSFAELASPGSWLTDSEENYESAKNRLKEILLDKYDAAFPGLKAHATSVVLGTPRTMKRYSSNPLGAVYGFAQTVSQSNNKRLGNRSPLKGLYLAGSWTQAGGGYEGSMMTGLKSAHNLLAEEGIQWMPLGTFAGKKNSIEAALEECKYPMYKLPAVVFAEDTDHRGCFTENAMLRFFDRGRVNLVEQSDELRNMRAELDKFFVHVYRSAIEITAEAQLGDKLDVMTGYRKSSSHRGSVDQLICNKDGQIIAKALFEIVFVQKGGELSELPSVYREFSKLPFSVSQPGLPKEVFAKDSPPDFTEEYYVYYEDTDAQGIIYNVSYFNFCQRALFSNQHMKQYGKNFTHYIPYRIEIRFLNSAGLGDTVAVKGRIRIISTDKFMIDYAVENKQTGKLLSEVSIEYNVTG